MCPLDNPSCGHLAVDVLALGGMVADLRFSSSVVCHPDSGFDFTTQNIVYMPSRSNHKGTLFIRSVLLECSNLTLTKDKELNVNCLLVTGW